MNAAEFRSIREQVGYSIEDIARTLEKSRSIVQKWEAGGREIPTAVAAEMEALQDAYADDLKAALALADSPVEVWEPRREEASWEATGRPSRWWRQIAAAVRQEHGSRIIWAHGVEHVELT